MHSVRIIQVIDDDYRHTKHVEENEYGQHDKDKLIIYEPYIYSVLTFSNIDTLT